ncbi:type II toxin-antitoxin system prevent-host-death family antitoxin [Variovorax ginsengisoli]|uniref:Antitoxin n=1 Tax=Variovorax ginsengisoli TaxID=363844 RepID=A0ABT8S1D8_9BURK|nr:type II toxin-antitoxin system prevent-host-death family antitoxin [Variovorax ginsengisoli]MDN8613458.1 type II toxin-antitoxin system prevent-host-death family antitoxin [Variovorax ginsengisoli]MDO1532628.1 type II toxin-antitoxin system prevent-host-death family antitoxin [Variovorax ginsengisoli]
MITALPALHDLPRQNASQVKNKWGDVVRQVRQSGSVAITNHAAVEMVLLDAATYQQLIEDLQTLGAREQTVLAELSARFDSRLAVLRQPEAARQVGDLFAARGRLARRPKAGASF